jgi:Sec-independent protein translocase protein TatA
MSDDREVVVVDRGGGGLKWLVLGAALGAGLALLFAPKAGRELRRDLGKGLRGLRELADGTLEEFHRERGDEGNLRAMADSGSAYDEEREGDLETAPGGSAGAGGPTSPAPTASPVGRPRTSMVAAREELERRLAAARARRRHPVPEDEEPVA